MSILGETGRPCKTRLAKSKRDLRLARLAKLMTTTNKNTALAKHIITKDHRVAGDHRKILTFETMYTKRRFLESFFIHNSENAINDKKIVFILKFVIIWRNPQLVIICF